MKASLYTRVSTEDQNSELQLRELQDYALRQGWDVADVYQDVASGAKERRPGLDRMMADAQAGRFDCLLVWKLDRFGRSLIHLDNSIRALKDCGVRFISITQGLDTDQRNPTSQFLFQVLGAVAELERSMIAERTHAGRARYRQDWEAGRVGKTVHSRSGRDLPPHRPKKVFDRQAVMDLHRAGVSMRGIAKRLRLSFGTVSRTVREWSTGNSPTHPPPSDPKVLATKRTGQP